MERVSEWSNKWVEGRTHWHLNQVNYALANHSAALLPVPKRRILVPLCGKAVDLKWLYDEGHTVVGVEGVLQPVMEFFSENKIPYVVSEFPAGKIFKSHDERLMIYCCDLFALDESNIGKFDAIWDRGSLVAIYEEDREKYATLIKSILAPNFRYLLSVVQYTPTPEFSGPPRNVPTQLLQQLFGDVSHLQVLESHSDSKSVEEKDRFSEVVFMLTPK